MTSETELTLGLPPGAYRRGDGFFRKTQRGRPSGTMEIERPVSLNRVEARQRHMDFYHHELGWLIDGYKLETDRGIKSILADNSESMVDPDAIKSGASI